MRESPGHLSRRLQNKGVRPRGCGFEQSVLTIINFGVIGNFRKITAKQGQVMAIIHAAYTPQAVNRALVIKTTNQRVTGIGRQRDDTARIDDLYRLPNQAWLRVVRMNLKILAHKKSKTATA
jgi:hypothetical protein